MKKSLNIHDWQAKYLHRKNVNEQSTVSKGEKCSSKNENVGDFTVEGEHEYEGLRFKILHYIPDGYKAVGEGDAKGQIASQFFNSYEEAQYHAEAELEGFLVGLEDELYEEQESLEEDHQSLDPETADRIEGLLNIPLKTKFLETGKDLIEDILREDPFDKEDVISHLANELTVHTKDLDTSPIKEVHKPRGTEKFNELAKLLEAAVHQAKLVYRDGIMDREAYEGTEGADISLLLEQIWNAFSTGNESDKTYADEIFK